MKIQKKTLFWIILLVLAIISFLYIITSIKKSNKTNTPTISKKIDIVPGNTTQQEIIKNLGEPISSNSGVLEYNSNSPTRNDEITLEGNSVSFYKEIVAYGDSTTYTELISKYGDSEYILYGTDAINGYYLYCYPEKGIAFLANPISSTVLEIWHFPKTNYKEFKTKWASNYSESFQGEN